MITLSSKRPATDFTANSGMPPMARIDRPYAFVGATSPILGALLLGTLTALPASVLHAEALTADFNGDGREDIVVGDRTATVGGHAYAGQVAIIARDANGEMRADVWHKDRIHFQGGAVGGGGFGSAVAVGDFNADGFDDLAVGSPNQALNGANLPRSGNVSILYGSSGGLTREGTELLRTSYIGAYNRVGASLATADFNSDGYIDLAVGIPERAPNGTGNTGPGQGVGAVAVYSGGPDGLVERTERLIWRGQPGVRGDAEAGAGFGTALATGDINGDGHDDLLIGAPWDDIGAPHEQQYANAGSLNLLFGSVNGLAYTSVLIRDRNEVNNRNDGFGTSLAVGDLDDDGFDDIAVGHPNERVGSRSAAGAVTVFYGDRWFGTGSTVRGSIWYQNRTGVPDTSESGDLFGAAVRIADFDSDGFADLAIGIPRETQERWLSDRRYAGSALVLYGRQDRQLEVRPGASDWHQDMPGVADTRETNDRFGSELSVGDFNGDSRPDLLIGVPYEKTSGVPGSGAIQFLHGSASGLRPLASPTQQLHRGNVRGLGGQTFGSVMP